MSCPVGYDCQAMVEVKDSCPNHLTCEKLQFSLLPNLIVYSQESHEPRPFFDPREFLEMPPGNCVLVYSSHGCGVHVPIPDLRGVDVVL